jgi:hypothetical protein
MNTPLDFGEPPGHEPEGPARERTGWVWAISIGYLLIAGLVPASFALLKSGLLLKVGTPTQKAAIQAYLDSLGPTDYVISGAIAVLMVCGSAALLRLSRFAFHFYALAFACSLVATARIVSSEHARALIGIQGLFQQALGLGLLAAAAIYCFVTTRQGYLK